MSTFQFEELGANLLAARDTAAIAALMQELSPENGLLSPRAINEVIKSPEYVTWVVRDKMTGMIVGAATLTIVQTLSTYNKPYGIIDDVVVHGDYRGYSLGRLLTEALIGSAKTLGLKKIILSSNPDNPKRAAARHLYQSLGFAPSTNGRWMILKLS